MDILRRFKSRKIRSAAVVALTLGLGFAFFGTRSCIKAYAGSCSTPVRTTEPLLSRELATRYYEYTPQALISAHNQGKVVLYFWAPWCATCSSLDLDLQSGKAAVPDGVIVLRIPYDQASDLKKKYHVVTQHTFVQVNNADVAISTWVGGDMDSFTTHLY